MKHEIQNNSLQVISCKHLYWSLFITEGGGGQGGKGGSEDLGCGKIRLT